MISYKADKRGCINNEPWGFIPYNHTTVGDLARIICNYTWSPIVFNNNYRKSDNFAFADLCVLDVDNDKEDVPIVTMEDVKKELCDCMYFIGTTKSHMISKNGKPPQERFRVILKFEERITDRAQYQASMRALRGLFDWMDGACVDAARPFYPCREIVYVQPQGELIPVFDAGIQKSQAQLRLDNALVSTRPLPKHIIEFLERGKTFGRGRNDSVFHAANYLLQKGLTILETINIIEEAPFDRTNDWKPREIANTVQSVYKREGLL